VLLLLGIAAAAYEDRFAAQRHSAEIREEAEILAQSVAAAVQFGDRAAAKDYVNALEANPEIRSAAVYDLNGAAIVTISRDGAKAPSARLSRPPAHPGSGELRFLAPVNQKGNRIGTVFLSALPEDLGTRAARLAGVVLLVAMAALLLAFLSADRLALARANLALKRRAADLFLANLRLKSETKARRETEEALHQSQKLEAIGHLSGSVAHDLNNYLALISGSLNQLTKRVSRTGTGILSYIDAAQEGVDRAAGLTRRLLAFARKQPLLPQAVTPTELIQGMLDFIKRSAGEKIALETRLDATWPIYCDAGHMEAVILNLANNARDAMPDGGKLVISTRDRTVRKLPGAAQDEFVPGEYVELIVRDNGAGMNEEVRKRALEPFFTTKPQGEGTGLGLSTAFGYIRQSGGYLWVESAPGRGTAITILMPRHLAQARTQPACVARDAA
jgi:signal transduction histidine kinase